MAVQAAAVPVYIGGVAVVAGALYLMTPQGQRSAQSLGEAMGQGASNATNNIKNLIWGDEADEVVAGAQSTTATDTATCPLIPYVHYTDLVAMGQILSTRIFMLGLGGGVYFTQGHHGPYTVWSIIFIGNIAYVEKAKSFVDILTDYTVPIALRQANAILSEYFHPGALRERPPKVQIVASGPNFFPEAPGFEGMMLP